MTQTVPTTQTTNPFTEGGDAGIRDGGPGAPHRPADRFEAGWRALARIDGEVGEKVVAALAGIAPDFGRLLVEFPFGDIYTRPGLDLRAREIATIAALCALGNAGPQLKVHIEAGLNVGLAREEIVEILMQMAVYAGFPAALNGLFAAKEVFAARDA
ncbi:carboxymuconolactone decarboxylase family protein [Ancylobacter sp. Lp-2]|uniref:carboxymuconolactone decarboxylase family protein n=1 Tax=Ancylobacter sp. Lp-2 TaxID=2881339 RepID=UPI001E500B26|nr:carboxymuconolactone decarboxylase family protein [Ancylobacter sp. Lp-2]MCB4770608.1 carboxymuconolactone decarboxylase family protein [Ancylobacter sp. Lp-2]